MVNELNVTITVFAYDATTGQIGKILQTIATESPDYNGRHSAAEILVHPSGKFLYASNRGQNNIVGYRIDSQTGWLSVIGFTAQGVSSPRNFAIDPSGKPLYVANQTGDSIVRFAVNFATGALTPNGQITFSISPVVKVFRRLS